MSYVLDALMPQALAPSAGLLWPPGRSQQGASGGEVFALGGGSLTTSRLITRYIDSDAAVRAWAQAFEQCLLDVGCQLVPCTTQLDLTTMTYFSGGLSGQRGYRVYNLWPGDGLPPFYMRVDFGNTGPTSSAAPYFGIQVAGTVNTSTGALVGGSAQKIFGNHVSYPEAPGNQRYTYACRGAGRFAIVDGLAPLAADKGRGNALYVVERFREPFTDALSSRGVVHFSSSAGAAGATSRVVAAPGVTLTGGFTMDRANCHLSGTTLVDGSVTHLLPWYVIERGLRPPLRAACGYFNADIAAGTPIAVEAFGGTHTYLPLGTLNQTTALCNESSATAPAAAILFE